MSKRTILVTGAGGAAALSFTRSLRDSGKDYRLVGIDCDKYTIHRAEVDKSYLCPRAQKYEYIPFLKYIIEKEGIEFLHAQPDVEVAIIGNRQPEILVTGCQLFLPPPATINTLRDKALSAFIWERAGIKVPENMKITTRLDLEDAFKKWGRNIWIRETHGAAGKGSLSKPSFRQAFEHIHQRDGWGLFMAAKHLTMDTVTWQSIWNEGKLVVAQGRKRLYWEFSNRTQSGVTGLTGTGEIIADAQVDAISQAAILAVDKEPHGIFSVDMTYDQDGIPNPTEINVGKFFTTHHFLTRTGCNMPLNLVDLAFGEYEGPYNVVNPCLRNYFWIRGIDKVPKIVHKTAIDAKVKEYQTIMEEVAL